MTLAIDDPLTIYTVRRFSVNGRGQEYCGFFREEEAAQRRAAELAKTFTGDFRILPIRLE